MERFLCVQVAVSGGVGRSEHRLRFPNVFGRPSKCQSTIDAKSPRAEHLSEVHETLSPGRAPGTQTPRL